jgi:hypothetical protein
MLRCFDGPLTPMTSSPALPVATFIAQWRDNLLSERGGANRKGWIALSTRRVFLRREATRCGLTKAQRWEFRSSASPIPKPVTPAKAGVQWQPPPPYWIPGCLRPPE